MEQMVAHKGFWCQKVHHGWNARITEMGNGQREVLVTKKYLYVPQGDYDDPDTRVVEVDQSGTQLQEEMDARRAERSAANSASRAKKNCRHRIKSGDFDEMLTLTYRANQDDFALVRKHFAAWLRKMRRAVEGFSAVWAFEKQKRGAWHVHVATHRLPPWLILAGSKVLSWRVGTALWRDVVGRDNGLCFVGGKGGRFQRKRSIADIAGYVSKYLTKDHADGPKGARRWDCTKNIQRPKVTMIHLPPAPMADIIPVVFDLRPGEMIVRNICSKLSDMYLLYTQPAPPVRGETV